MKTKLRKRYYCDFCKKSGGSAHHMLEHEKHCTMNPDRVCRVCYLLSEKQPKMSDLLAVLPREDDFKDRNDGGEAFYQAGLAVLPKLRDAANDCPACILATLRQTGGVYAYGEFDFKAEMTSLFSEINSEREEAY